MHARLISPVQLSQYCGSTHVRVVACSAPKASSAEGPQPVPGRMPSPWASRHTAVTPSSPSSQVCVPCLAVIVHEYTTVGSRAAGVGAWRSMLVTASMLGRLPWGACMVVSSKGSGVTVFLAFNALRRRLLDGSVSGPGQRVCNGSGHGWFWFLQPHLRLLPHPAVLSHGQCGCPLEQQWHRLKPGYWAGSQSTRFIWHIHCGPVVLTPPVCPTMLRQQTVCICEARGMVGCIATNPHHST